MTERFSAAFLGMFEALRMAPTFARGRRDARAGHVRHLSISSSLVTAQVRGPDDARPFRARIAVRAFGAAEWARVEEALAAQARFTAELLAGRMPAGIEEVFGDAGLTLLPLSLSEVALDCTCERWPMPCVHLAATCYALADSFETDPFGVFAWRGHGRDELLTRLTELRGVPARVEPSTSPEPPDASLGDIADFWGIRTPTARVAAPPSAAASAAPPASSALPASPASPASSVSAVPSASAAPAAPPASAASVASTTGFSAAGGAAYSSGHRPVAARADLLLDQLDPPDLRYGGQSLADLLRPAYRALPL